jgi:hypothetical protein
MTFDAPRRHDPLRKLLARLLDWESAHVGFDAAVDGLPPELRGQQPAGLPYSAWQVLEHLRLAQHDILEYCRNPNYREPQWPRDYWPESAAPPSGSAWDASVAACREDRKALQRIAADPGVDVTATLPYGRDATYIEELLLAADHAAYHVGQLVLIRRLLGAWPAPRAAGADVT